MLAEDIAKLMTLIPNEEMKARQEGTDRIEGGAFEAVLTKETPFMYKGGEGINAGAGEIDWVVAKERYKYDEAFDKLSPIDGKVTGAGKQILYLNVEELLFFLCVFTIYFFEQALSFSSCNSEI